MKRVKLPPSIIDIIQWCYWKRNWSTNQIASNIGISTSTVSKYINIPSRYKRNPQPGMDYGHNQTERHPNLKVL